MAATGDERVVPELKACRDSLGEIRSELNNSLTQFQQQVTGLRDSLNEADQNYRSLQTQLDQLKQGSADLEIQLQAAKNLDARLEQIDGNLQRVEALPEPERPPIQGLDPILLKHTLRTLTAATSQEEILDAFLDLASKKVDRSILFASKDGSYIPWRSRGFSQDALDSVVVDDPTDPILTVSRSRQLIYREQAPAEARPSLGEAGDMPHAFSAIPLVFEDFVPVIFYADSSNSFDIDYLEVLSYLAVLVLKNNALQQLSGEPKGAELEGPPKTEAAPAPPPVQPLVSEPEPAPAPEPVAPPEPVAQEPAPAPAPPEPEVPIEVPITEDWEIPESMKEGAKPTPPPPPVVETPKPEPLRAVVPPPPAPAPQPQAAPEPIPSMPAEDQEKFGNEARRFARLLVSEIKLYNEDEVYNGRQSGDLYNRLKRDIDRSREMYEKRVHPGIAQSFDYFHEELVRILAREDANLMGSGYPGPVLRK